MQLIDAWRAKPMKDPLSAPASRGHSSDADNNGTVYREIS